MQSSKSYNPVLVPTGCQHPVSSTAAPPKSFGSSHEIFMRVAHTIQFYALALTIRAMKFGVFR